MEVKKKYIVRPLWIPNKANVRLRFHSFKWGQSCKQYPEQELRAARNPTCPSQSSLLALPAFVGGYDPHPTLLAGDASIAVMATSGLGPRRAEKGVQPGVFPTAPSPPQWTKHLQRGQTPRGPGGSEVYL